MIVQRLIAAVREWAQRLYGSLRLRSDETAARAELAHHLALAEEKFLQRGHSPAEAARLARASCGQADNTLELLRAQRGIPWFGVFTIDVKLGIRMLRKSLGLTLIGGLAMSVGFTMIIGVFMYMDILMWSDSIPLDDGDRVVAIQLWDPENGRRSEISTDDLERWRTELKSLEDIGAFRTVEHEIVHVDGDAESVPIAEISAAGFRLARVAPLIGRPLLGEDERQGAEPAIVIGYDEWQSRFGGITDVLGREIRLDDGYHTIVGVMPEDFGFPINHQFWVPLHDEAIELVSAPPAGAVFARLAPGVTLEQAQAELSATGLLAAGTDSERAVPLRPTVVQYATNFISDTDPNDLAKRPWNARMVILLVSLLLIPPCVNIAMLVYARTVTRKEEIAVRTALGASRRRIILQMFVEMLLLSTLSVCLALVSVNLLVGFVERLMRESLGRLPFWVNFSVSGDTLFFAIALAVLAAGITGLVPALSATKWYAKPGLSALDGRNRMRLGPIWTLLIITQIAFAFAALPSAVELGWGVLRSSLLGPGFAAEEYLTARLGFEVDGADQQLPPDPAITIRFNDARRRLVQRLESDSRLLTPVTQASAVPGEGRFARFQVEDEAETIDDENEPGLRLGVPLVRSISIDEHYLDVFDIEILTGRGFGSEEYRPDAGPVLVNATFAQDQFGNANPLGRRIRFVLPPQAPNGDAEESWYEIVGVIADRPAHPYRGSIFHPADPNSAALATIAFRADATGGELREDLHDMAAAIDPALEVRDIRTLKELYDEQATGNYLGGFALIAASLSVLALAAAGTYALMAFTVNQRRREIAIRLALGAQPRKMLRGIFRSALRQVAIGATAGALLALFVQSYIPATLLGGLEVPGILPSAVALLILIGIAASFGPARRALQTDPTESLKNEA